MSIVKHLKYLVITTIGIVLAACGGYDMNSKELAYLSGSKNVLYLSNADGSNPIKLNENVKHFQWRLDENEIQVTKKSSSTDLERSEFSVYRMPLEDVHTAERVGTATGSDTTLIDRSGSKKKFSKGGKEYEYMLVNDSLYVTINGGKRSLVRANVHSYSLKR